jgi:hypothetical protein
MTNAEWASSSSPDEMLESLFARRKPSSRKLRLFVCACCRHVPELLTDERARPTVDVVERFADALATGAELSKALDVHWSVPHSRVLRQLTPAHALSVRSAIASVALDGVAERQHQAHLIRCIFDSIYRPVVLEPAWLSSDVVALAQGIYGDKAFDRMPILADALQDAGCENEAILSHCRGDGPHVRGCWVIDALLGKA